MEANHGHKKYRVIDDELVLLNQEYYLSVLRVSLDQLDSKVGFETFDVLYSFTSSDIELEIDVSEEEKGLWYLQLLVPAMLTLPESAQRRIRRGREALNDYLLREQLPLPLQALAGDEIFNYVKRYAQELIVE